MTETTDRVEEFRTDIAAMRLKDPVLGRESLLLRAGAAAMAAGVVVAIIAYFLSHKTKDPLAQRDAIVMAIAGASVTVMGAAVWLRYSLAGFLRFWLARLIYEQRAQMDRLVEQPPGASNPVD
jgi:hypothetical protein